MEWQENASRLHRFIKDVNPKPSRFSFLRSAGVKLNCLQIDIGLFCYKTHKWGMVSTTACECGAKQTAEHVITFFPIYHHPNGACALSDVSKNLATWLMKTCLAI